MTFRVRSATLSDGPRLLELGRQAHAESAYSDREFNTQIAAMLFNECCTSDLACVALLTDSSGIRGIMAARLSVTMFQTDMIASEIVTYIEPECRSIRTHKMLISYIEQWARANDARYIELGVSGRADFETHDRLYSLAGYRVWSTVYTKEL